jgi:hypothetical protein
LKRLVGPVVKWFTQHGRSGWIRSVCAARPGKVTASFIPVAPFDDRFGGKLPFAIRRASTPLYQQAPDWLAPGEPECSGFTREAPGRRHGTFGHSTLCGGHFETATYLDTCSSTAWLGLIPNPWVSRAGSDAPGMMMNRIQPRWFGFIA